MSTADNKQERQSWDRVAKWGPLALAAARFIVDLVHRLHG